MLRQLQAFVFYFLIPVANHSQAPVPVVRKSNDVARVTSEIYTQDGDYIKDIEINDLRNRYLLTKGATQKMVNYHFVLLALIFITV
jgi:hypothetical protein